MMDIKNLKQYQIERPDHWSSFGDREDFDRLPAIHRDQIIFLNKAATGFLYEYLRIAKLIANNDDPFSKGNFKTVEHFKKINDEIALKKWLYKRGVPFKSEVFVLGDDYAVITTWKIIVKYSPDLFHSTDLAVFDEALNWCLFYFHHDHMFFGKDNIYDNSMDYIKMKEINRLKKLYPQVKFPY